MTIDKQTLIKILGREELTFLVNAHKHLKIGKKILLTGANGSIGSRLSERLSLMGEDFITTDIEGDHEFLDVTDVESIRKVVKQYNPDIIINIAGAKHAPEGEHETWKTFNINTVGTKNILDVVGKTTEVILTSTCKSCNPETVYGSSKLIAERMVLNEGGRVARFFNVVETQGNVFEIWRDLPKESPIAVSSTCKRHFISLDEATGLILCVASLKDTGRYIVNSPLLRNMMDVANAVYVDREKIIISPRRGDRLEEKFLSTNESVGELLFDNSVIRVKNSNDK